MQDWVYYVLPASIFVPLYSWTLLFFAVPLFFIEPLYFIFLLLNGASFSNKLTNYYYYLWTLVVAWFGIPIFEFFAIFGEIFLIPIFFIGLTYILANYIFFIIFVLYYILPKNGIWI